MRDDGTVVATGNNKFGQCDVQNWRDVVAISAGGWQTFGICSDGTVLCAGKTSGNNITNLKK